MVSLPDWRDLAEIIMQIEEQLPGERGPVVVPVKLTTADWGLLLDVARMVRGIAAKREIHKP